MYKETLVDTFHILGAKYRMGSIAESSGSQSNGKYTVGESA